MKLRFLPDRNVLKDPFLTVFLIPTLFEYLLELLKTRRLYSPSAGETTLSGGTFRIISPLQDVPYSPGNIKALRVQHLRRSSKGTRS